MILLLDTNAYSAFRKGDVRVRRHIAASEGLAFSATVAGELIYGFRNGTHTAENLRSLGEFIATPQVRFLEVGYATADRFGRIATQLRESGSPIPTNDIWIAAHAMEVGAYLLSFDRHFDHVAGLAWIDPAD